MPGGHEHQRDVIQKDLLIPLEPYTQCGVVVLIVSIRFQVETVLPFVSDVPKGPIQRRVCCISIKTYYDVRS